MKNLEMLALAAKSLKPLGMEVVFVGGATIELYLADRAARNVRATNDVDCVVEVATRADFHRLEERLRALGFKHPSDPKAPICRWELGGILVDVMPLAEDILGFANRWYPEGFEHRMSVGLPGGQTVLVFPLSYLVASKLEAFGGRGHEDFMGSSDMEDIVTLVDGVPDFQSQILGAPEAVKTYLKAQFQKLISDGRFLDALEGHLPPSAGAGRAARARAVLQAVSATAE